MSVIFIALAILALLVSILATCVAIALPKLRLPSAIIAVLCLGVVVSSSGLFLWIVFRMG